MTKGTRAGGGHRRLPPLSLPGALSRLGEGAAGAAAAGRCSFRFANEKLGEEGKNLLRDVFSNLPYQPGREMRCPRWQASAVPAAWCSAGRHLVGPCLGQELTRRVGFGASTEGTGLAVPRDVRHM